MSVVRLTVKFHPEAVSEAERARDWYASHSELAADRFVREVANGVDDIRDLPDAWPVYRESFRKRVLSRFPFSIIYRVVGGVIEIVAIAHDKKRPGYWTAR